MIVVLLAAGVAAAHEEIPEVEVFAGYSMMKMGASKDDLRPFQEGYSFPGSKWNNDDMSFFLSRGVTGSVAVNLNEYFSIATDARYYQGDPVKGSFEFISPETFSTVQSPFVIGIKNVSALAGPRVSLRKEKTTTFVHALAGLDYWRLNCDLTIAGVKLDATANSLGPGVSIGGGFDVNVNEKIAVRVIQADYYRTRHMERWMNNVNLSFGLVFRIGEKVLK